AIGDAGAIRGLVGDRFEFGELAGVRIEAQGAVRRRRPNLPLSVVVDGGGAAGRRHPGRRNEHIEAFGLGVHPPDAAASWIDVEPEDAVRIARHAVGLRHEALPAWHGEQLDRAGLARDAADGDLLVRNVAGEPEVALEIEPGVVHAPAGDYYR